MSDEPIDHRKAARPTVRPERAANQATPPGTEPVAPEMLEDLFRHSPQPFAAGRPDGSIIALNQACCDLLGYTPEELEQLDWSKDLTPPEWREHEAAMLEVLIRTGQPVRYEKEFIHGDGSRIPVELLVYLSSAGDGAVPYFWVSIYDLSERKRAEQEIEILARFPEENPYPVLRLSGNDTVLYANPSAQAILREDGCAVGERAPTYLRTMARQALHSGTTVTVDVERNGKLWSFLVVPLADAGYANLYGRDITERERLAGEVVERAAELQAILDAAPVAVWLAHDPDASRITGNAYADALFQAPPGGNISRSAPPDQADVSYKAFRDGVELQPEELPAQIAAATGRTVEGAELDLVFPDGRHVHLLANAVPLLDADGRPRGSVTAGLDVTKMKQADEALRESEEKYRLLADGIGDGFYALDSGWRFVYVNDATVEYLGKSRDELLGQHLLEAFPKVRGTIFETEYRRVIEAGEIAHFEATSVVTGRVVEVNAYPGRGQMIVFFRDVTERKEAQEALRESEERYRRIVETAQEGIIIADAEGAISFVNARMAEMLGYSPLELIGKPGTALIDPSDLAVTTLSADRIEKRKAGETEHYEIRLMRKDGGDLWAHVSGTPVHDSNGNHVGNLGMYADITERKRTEDALRVAVERLERAQTGAGVGVWDWDIATGRIEWSSYMFNLFGLDEAKTVASFDVWESILHPEDREAAGLHIDQALKDRTMLQSEYRIVRPDRQTRWINAVGRSTYDAEGNPLRMAGICTDITDRKRVEEELRLQSTALQAAANGIVITDRDGNIQWVNDAFTRLTGYSAAEAAGNNPRVLKSGRHDEPFYKDLWDTVLSGRVWHGEIVNKRKDGRLYTEEMTITPVVDANGAVTNFIAIKTDISARKRAEEAMAEANARVQKLLSANVIGIAEFDATKIVSANRALLAMSGYSERDVERGKIDWREITPPEYAERDNRAWGEMMERGECLPYEKEYITKDGKRLPILIAGVRLTEDPVTGVFLNLDITDWKLMENELLETTHYAEHLFESRLIGLTRFDANGLVDANDAFLEMVGYTREDLKAGLIDVAAMTPTEYRALDERAMGEMLATEESTANEKEYVRKDGSRVSVLIGRKLIRESPLEWVAFVLDLTERKRAEADLDRMRTEFLGEVSHELKTPLTAIKGCASMALSAGTPPDPAETRELFEVVDAQANRLTDLVGNLLDMTRIEAGRLSIEPTETDVGKILEEARTIFEHSRYPHSLQIELPSKLPRIKADGRRVVQVLSNLLNNAAKFSSPDTPIVISAERNGGEVIVSVRDSGAGIPADKMPLLFQKFVQVHTVGARGTGLGLFICKGIVEAQGGRIWAESGGEGRGTTFSFALPAVAGRSPTTKARAAARIPAGRKGRVDGARIVAIDDEPHILRYVEHCLKSANYEVASTTDPRAAAGLVKSHNPDIVLLDMRLPGTSGLEVLEEIRAFSDVPVAFITATANREDVERGRDFGGTTWLEKPFSREQLLGHVGGIVARRRRQRNR